MARPRDGLFRKLAGYASLVAAFCLLPASSSAQADGGVVYELARPINQPVPSFPRMAAWLGMSGRCDVRFSVDEQGYAVALDTLCSAPIFCYESKKAVSAVRFLPKYKNGIPQFSTNVVFPLMYLLEGEDAGRVDALDLLPCNKRAIS